jgi:hypothetical protein
MSRQWIRFARGFALWAAPWGLFLAAALPAVAQAPAPVGSEFQVNSHYPNGQTYPSVAMQPGGDFVVVWESYTSPGTDTSSSSIQARRFTSDGSALGAQFQVNTYTTGLQRVPAVSAADDGAFVVAWWGNGSFGTDTSVSAVQAQRFASDGSPQGTQFQVNTYTTLQQLSPSVASDAAGNFVVVWASSGSSGTDTSGYSIQGQRYASNGTAQGGEFQVNSYTTSQQKVFRVFSVAADTDGDFVVVWDSFGSFGPDTSFSIQGQRFDSDGSAQGAQFQINAYTTGHQFRPCVAADDDGDFVVVWDSAGSQGTDTSSYSVQGQRFASNGSFEGAQFQVNGYTLGYQEVTSVAVDSDRDFVVVWDNVGSFGTDSSAQSVQGRRFSSNGTSLGGQFQINSYTTDDQKLPAVAATASGDFVVVWDSFGSFGPDTDTSSILGQLFSVPAPEPPPVPAMSRAARFALGAALLLLGAGYALRRRS